MSNKLFLFSGVIIFFNCNVNAMDDKQIDALLDSAQKAGNIRLNDANNSANNTLNDAYNEYKRTDNEGLRNKIISQGNEIKTIKQNIVVKKNTERRLAEAKQLEIQRQQTLERNNEFELRRQELNSQAQRVQQQIEDDGNNIASSNYQKKEKVNMPSQAKCASFKLTKKEDDRVQWFTFTNKCPYSIRVYYRFRYGERAAMSLESGQTDKSWYLLEKNNVDGYNACGLKNGKYDIFYNHEMNQCWSFVDIRSY